MKTRTAKKVALAAVVGIALVGLSAAQASAGGLFPFRTEIVGNEVDGQVVAGIPGGAPWVIDDGDVLISRFNTIHADADGLLLLNGTVGPVLEVFASLHCSTGATGEEAFTEVARSKNAPISAEGDFKIFDFISVPSQCTAAIVLIRVSVIDAGFIGGPPGTPVNLEDLGVTPPWIAASGL